jgi:hypothetical protein
MRNLFILLAVVAAISCAPTPVRAGDGLFGLFGFDCGGCHNQCCSQCGESTCGCENSFGCNSCCEPACGCDSCCEPACGCTSCCEPCCGCGSGCCANGRQYAGQTFNCGCETYVPWCPCRDCGGGCGGCCEPACGCGSCCEPTCGCDSCCEPCGCGSCCGSGCCTHKCCVKKCGFCHAGWELVDCFTRVCSPCSGCSGEVYWSEWHNDPPYCQDPCNCCGQFTGHGCCGSDGCCTSGCGCEGGYAQNHTGSNSAAYVKSTSANANRSQVAQTTRPQQRRPANMVRSANQQGHATYASQQPSQQTQVRMASRPTTNRAAVNGNAAAQARPILW